MTEEKNTDWKQFRIYSDGVIKYDARYPLQEHWINQIVKKWWEKQQIKNIIKRRKLYVLRNSELPCNILL